MGDDFRRAQMGMTGVTASESSKRAATYDREADHGYRAEMRALKEREAAWRQFYDRRTRMARSSVAEPAMPKMPSPASAKGETDAAGGSSWKDEIRRREQAEEQALRRQAVREEQARQKRLAAEKRAADKELSEWRKAMLKRENAAEKSAERERLRVERERAKAQKTYERTIAKQQKDAEASLKRAQAAAAGAKSQFRESFESSGESIMRMSRGFVLLGLAGEENLEKMMRGLVKMQAVVDLVTGGIQTITRLSRMREALGAMVISAQQAEHLQRQKNIALMGAETAAAKNLARAKALAAAGTGVGGGRQAGSGVAGTVGTAGTAYTAGQMTRGLGGKAVGVAKYTGVAAGVVAGGVLVTNIIAGMLSQFGSDKIKATMRKQRWFEPGTWSGWSMRSSWIAPGVSQAQDRAKAGVEANQKRQQERGRAAQMTTARQARLAAEGDATRSQQARALEAAYRRIEETADRRKLTDERRDVFIARQRQREAIHQLWQPEQELNAARQRLQDAVSGNDRSGAMAARDQISEARKTALAASERMTAAVQDRLQAEEAIARTRIDAANKALETARAELESRRQMMQAEKDRLRTAEERFGQLDRMQQRELIRIQEKARRGGRLTIDEVRELESLGTRGTDRIASATYRRRAEAAGFSQYFGEEERRRVSRLQKEAQDLAVTIRDKRELKVKIEQDSESLARSLRDIIRRELDVQQKLNEEMATRIAREEMERIARQNEQRELAREQSR